jgi:hypothetical protein
MPPKRAYGTKQKKWLNEELSDFSKQSSLENFDSRGISAKARINSKQQQNFH